MIKRLINVYLVYMTIAISGMVFVSILLFFYSGFVTGSITLVPIASGVISGLCVLFLAHVFPTRFRWLKINRIKETYRYEIWLQERRKIEMEAEKFRMNAIKELEEYRLKLQLEMGETQARVMSEIAQDVVNEWRKKENSLKENEPKQLK